MKTKITILSLLIALFFRSNYILAFFICRELFIFLFWFFGDTNPYKTIMFVGGKGVGKTSYIAKLALQFNNEIERKQKGGQILQSEGCGKPQFYTNVEGIANTAYFNLDQLETFRPVEGSVICADEIGLWVDARKFKSFSDGLNEFFKYARQYKCRIYLFSQAWSSDVDLKVRNMVDRIYVGKRIGKVTIWRPISKQFGVVKRADGTGDIGDNYKFCNFLWIGCRFIYLPRYYGLFKSFNPPERDLIVYSLQTASDVSRVYQNTLSWAVYTIRCFFKNKAERLKERLKTRRFSEN